LISKPTNEPSSKLIRKVNGINTSYMFEAVNGVNAKQFEAVNGINTSYTFEAVNGVSANQFEAVNGINTSYTFEAANGVNVDASQPTVAKTSEGARNPSSMLIVGRNMALGPAFGHNSASGPAFGHNLAFGLIMAFGLNDLFTVIRRIGLIGLINFNGLISVISFGLVTLSASAVLLAHRPCEFAAATRQVGPVGCISPNSFNGVGGLISQVGLNSLIDLSFVSLAGLIDNISIIGSFIDFVGLGLVSLGGLISDISLVGIIDLSLISYYGLMSFIGLGGHNRNISLVDIIGISLISHHGLIRFIGLGISLDLISLVGLIGHISLVSLGSFSGIDGCSLIELIGHISLVSFICVSGWHAHARKKYSDNNDMLQDQFAAAIPAAAARTNGVAMASSATKITNAAIWYYCTAHYWFVREGLLWHVPRLDSNPSYHGDALQYTKQLFHISLPQMTKYCIMRECENILCGYLYDGD
jgi:hypothetical protein